MIPGLPVGIIAALPLLEDLGIPSRIACPAGDQPGCFRAPRRIWRAVGWTFRRAWPMSPCLPVVAKALLANVQALADAYRLARQTRAASLS